jgi:hypothetical protein
MAKRKAPDIQQRMRLNVEAHELSKEADVQEAAGQRAKALATRKRALRLLEKADGMTRLPSKRK